MFRLTVTILLLVLASNAGASIDATYFDPGYGFTFEEAVRYETELDSVLRGEHDYDWLYEQLISNEDRQTQPAESFKSFRVHLRDSNAFFPPQEDIRKSYLDSRSEIIGSIKYVGIFPKRYAYAVEGTQDGSAIIHVRIHFQDLDEGGLRDFTARVKGAELIWNQHRIVRDFKYSFHFEVVSDANQAHFSVQVLDDTRGPYDQYWSRRWTPTAIAHEIGHMMGLGDEYQTLSGKVDCLKKSLMCESWTGDPMPHHYYFILRRLMKGAVPSGQ